MKKGSHKNQIVITTLALLLAVVGYISYDNRDMFATAKDVISTEVKAEKTEADAGVTGTEETQDVAMENADGQIDSTEEEILNAGETVLTSAVSDNANYVAQVKLGREQVRSTNKASLQEIIDNAALSEAEKKSAVDEMVKITQNAQMEVDAETLLSAKCFENVVVSISDGCCDVIVGKDDVTDEKRAQIEDIIKRKTNIGEDANIVISTMD